MSKYTKEPDLKDFILWLEKSPYSNNFYNDHILPLVLDLEMDDYFGTEGFDKRFS